MSNSIGGSQSKMGFTLYTGFAPVQVVMVNPTMEEFQQYTGRPAPYELKYETSLNPNSNRMESPLVFWCKYENNIYPLRINIGADVIVDRSGKKSEFINRLGQFSYYAESANELIENEALGWYNKEMITPLRVGEKALHTFLQRLLSYNAKDKKANWIPDLEGVGFTFTALLNGDLTGIKNIINEANAHDNRVGVLFVVKRTDEGKEYQELCSNPDTFLFVSTETGKILQSGITYFNKVMKDYEERGRRITSRLFTVNFQPYNQEDCINNEPIVTDSATTNW